MLEVRHLSYRFLKDEKYILEDICCVFPSRGLVILEGESGSGKSTFLSLLHARRKIEKGEILFKGSPMSFWEEERKIDYRLFDCAMVFQDYGLFSNLSIEENMLFFASCSSKKKDFLPLLKKVNLQKDIKTKVEVLSGGEKQRLAIARALYYDTSLLLLDEPTSSLDEENAHAIMRLLKNISKEKLVIMVSHDLRFISLYADEHYHLQNGKLIQKAIKKQEGILFKKEKYHRKKPQLFLYLWSSLKKKKRRTYITTLFLSFSIFLGSFSSLLLSSMKEEIQDTFSSLVTGREFMMSIDEEMTEERESLTKEELQELQKEEESVVAVSSYYADDLSSFFPSRNEFRILSLPTYPILKGFQAQEINNFRLLEEKTSSCFPSLSSLKNDEVVLGLPFTTLSSLGKLLSLSENTYEAFGVYLKNHPLKIVLYVKNIDWDYEDEQIFLWRGVIETEVPQIYHENPFFNTEVFENQMRLPSLLSFNEEGEYPWYLHKRSIVISSTSLPERWIYRSYFDRYLLDEMESQSTFYRYMVSFSNQKYLLKRDIYEILDANDSLLGAFYGSQKGYQIMGNTMIHGLPGYLFISNQKGELDSVLDAYHQEDISSFFHLSFHSLFCPTEQTLALRPYQKGIAISSSLAKKWKLNEQDTISFLYLQDEQKWIEGEWKVSFIIQEKKDTLFLAQDILDQLWIANHFATSSYLLPQKAIFYGKNENQTKSMMQRCKELYPQYTFLSPSIDFYEQLHQTSQTFLLGFDSFSFWMMILSCLLFITVHSLYLLEMKKELEKMEELGMLLDARRKVAFHLHGLFFLLSLTLSLFYLFSLYGLNQISIFKEKMILSFHFTFSTLISFLFFSLTFYGITFLYFLFENAKYERRKRNKK